ncbi:MAG: class I SAM-dependent methyltransferase [Pirellulales bacterium]
MKTPPEISCPVCDRRESEPFVQRSVVPVHQNLLCESQASAHRLARGALNMHICRHCGFIFNATFDPRLLEYGQQYDNTQTYSATFQEYVGRLIGRLAHLPEVRRGSIVEVGCGKGGFLRQLIMAAGPHCQGHGYDPAYEGAEIDLAGQLHFHRCFYDPQHAEQQADVVISRHVIEHVPQPMSLLRSIRRALAHSPRARVCFETPCARWILQHEVVWDFFYEHCSLFTADTLAAAFQLAGFRVESVEHIFGGQYLWLEAVPGTAVLEPPVPKTGEVLDLARRFTVRESQLVEHWRRQIVQRADRGGVVLWGGGAKGVTFANLIDPDRRWIVGVVDVNPNKQGRFLPGSGHRILPPAALAHLPVTAAVLLNPNYTEEVTSQLRSLGLDVSVVDLMNESLVAL